MPLNVVAVPVKDVIRRARQPRPHAQTGIVEEPAVSPPRLVVPSPKWSSKISPTLWRHLRNEQRRGGQGSPASPAAADTSPASPPGPPLVMKWSPQESYSHGVLYVLPGGLDNNHSAGDAERKNIPAEISVPSLTSSPRRNPDSARRRNIKKNNAVASHKPVGGGEMKFPGEQLGDVCPRPRSPAADTTPEPPSKPPIHPPHIPRPPMGSTAAASTASLESLGASAPVATNIFPVAPPREGSAKSRSSAAGSTLSSRPWVRKLVLKGLETIKQLDVGSRSPRTQGGAACGSSGTTRRLWTASTEQRLTGLAHACDRCKTARTHEESPTDHDGEDFSTPRMFVLQKTRLHDRVVRHLNSARPYRNGLERVSLIDRPSVVSDVIVPTGYVKPPRETVVLPSPRVHYRMGAAGNLGKSDSAVQRALQSYKEEVKTASASAN